MVDENRKELGFSILTQNINWFKVNFLKLNEYISMIPALFLKLIRFKCNFNLYIL